MSAIGLGGVEVPGVEGPEYPARNRVAQIELVRANGVALDAQAEQLSFDRIQVEARIDLLGQDPVERADQQLARRLAIDRGVLVAIWNPDVRDTWRAELLSEVGADSPGRDAVLDPEVADGLVMGWPA